ncbi:MAG TPA: slipin family protein, partial [Terriglobia bacterium]|nr:slipin family protein [Terriglobia bacterium]
SSVLSREPVSIQLRYLQTLTEIGVEKNTTIVFPLPIDIFTRILPPAGKTGSTAAGQSSAAPQGAAG